MFVICYFQSVLKCCLFLSHLWCIMAPAKYMYIVHCIFYPNLIPNFINIDLYEANFSTV